MFFEGDAYGGMVDVLALWLMLRPPRRYEGLVVEDGPVLASREAAPGELVGAMEGLKKVVVFVPERYEVYWEGMAGLFSLYLRPGMDIAERRRLLRERYGVDLTAEAREDMEKMESMGAALRREARLEGVQFGLRQGIQKGMQEGMQQGQVGMIHDFARMQHVSYERSMEMHGVPKEDWPQYLEILEDLDKS